MHIIAIKSILRKAHTAQMMNNMTIFLRFIIKKQVAFYRTAYMTHATRWPLMESRSFDMWMLPLHVQLPSNILIFHRYKQVKDFNSIKSYEDFKVTV